MLLCWLSAKCQLPFVIVSLDFFFNDMIRKYEIEYAMLFFFFFYDMIIWLKIYIMFMFLCLLLPNKIE